MTPLVQKFGGTSVAGPLRIRAVAERIARARRSQRELVVDPNRRELDQLLATGEVVSSALLAMALGSLGVPATSLTAAQVGIHTDDAHTRATIRRIDLERIRGELAHGRVVVVAGFQGMGVAAARRAELLEQTLKQAGIETLPLATSPLRAATLVPADRIADAVNLLHSALGLDAARGF